MMTRGSHPEVPFLSWALAATQVYLVELTLEMTEKSRLCWDYICSRSHNMVTGTLRCLEGQGVSLLPLSGVG